MIASSNAKSSGIGKRGASHDHNEANLGKAANISLRTSDKFKQMIDKLMYQASSVAAVNSSN
jgi:hypothetical protein